VNKIQHHGLNPNAAIADFSIPTFENQKSYDNQKSYHTFTQEPSIELLRIAPGRSPRYDLDSSPALYPNWNPPTLPSEFANPLSLPSESPFPFLFDSAGSYSTDFFSPPYDLFFEDLSPIQSLRSMSSTPQNAIFHDIRQTSFNSNDISTTNSPPPVPSLLGPSDTPPVQAPPVAIDRLTKRHKCSQCPAYFAQEKQLRQVLHHALIPCLLYKPLQPLPQSRNIPNCP
jgi:hypothetical protein